MPGLATSVVVQEGLELALVQHEEVVGGVVLLSHVVISMS